MEEEGDHLVAPSPPSDRDVNRHFAEREEEEEEEEVAVD